MNTLLNKFSKLAVAELVEAKAALLGIQTSLRQAQASFRKLNYLLNNAMNYELPFELLSVFCLS